MPLRLANTNGCVCVCVGGGGGGWVAPPHSLLDGSSTTAFYPALLSSGRGTSF